MQHLRAWIDSALRDLRLAWRTIVRMPGLAVVVVVSLGVGIGVNTAIFSWLEYRDLRERLRSFPGLIAFRMAPLNVGEADRTERAYGLLVSGNYFSALGLTPA